MFRYSLDVRCCVDIVLISSRYCVNIVSRYCIDIVSIYRTVSTSADIWPLCPVSMCPTAAVPEAACLRMATWQVVARSLPATAMLPSAATSAISRCATYTAASPAATCRTCPAWQSSADLRHSSGNCWRSGTRTPGQTCKQCLTMFDV